MFSEHAARGERTLLSASLPEQHGPTFERLPPASYTNCSACFTLGERHFNRQYASIYASRLKQMRPALIERAKLKWGMGTVCGEETCEV
ncbi:DNA polymerase delta subunit 2-like [Leucoraja erinacea]|uniref:DNA polymerase delta subunit 2-like n=1 Tax=Leucoraja erinaceus TaxID=7782 RepID=UPI0024586302|nr:DNA polymerase delta subunit 2-like [Leucoraja erinacea]